MYHVISTEQHHVHRFHITIDQIEKEGKTYTFSYANFLDGITVIPFLSDNEVLLLREYRHAIKSWQYQFPSGMIEAGEEPAETARKEIAEETGYECADLIYLGYMYPSFGSTTEKIHLFAAKLGAPAKDCAKEALEEITTETVTVEKLEAMMNENQFTHAAGLVAWLKWKIREQ